MITLTKDQIESVVKATQERARLSPWDGEGDEKRMFTALVFEEAKKHIPIFLAMFLMTSMVYNPGPGGDKEKVVESMSNDPTLAKMIADMIYLGYQLGRLEPR